MIRFTTFSCIFGGLCLLSSDGPHFPTINIIGLGLFALGTYIIRGYRPRRRCAQ